MKKIIANIVLFVARWKSSYKTEFNIDRCVMVAGPHTSNWDFLYAMAIFWKHDVNVKFFIKDAFTKGIHGGFFRWMGAIGVDRSKTNNLVDHAIQLFNENEKLVMLVPAEGTRNRVDKWKKGFYHIASGANVPVALGYLDYKNKMAGVDKMINLTGDFKVDMKIIEDFYKTKTAKHPELYNPSIY